MVLTPLQPAGNSFLGSFVYNGPSLLRGSFKGWRWSDDGWFCRCGSESTDKVCLDPILKERELMVSIQLCGVTQDDQDEQKQQESMRTLIQTWMDSLQLISLIVSKFLTCCYYHLHKLMIMLNYSYSPDK